MLLSSAKLPGFVAVILCKEEFLISRGFFPLFCGPFCIYSIGSQEMEWVPSVSFLPLPRAPCVSAPCLNLGSFGHIRPFNVPVQRCCAGLLLFEAVLLYCSVSFHSDVYINNWMPLVGCNYTPGSYIHQFSSAFFFFFPQKSGGSCGNRCCSFNKCSHSNACSTWVGFSEQRSFFYL